MLMGKFFKNSQANRATEQTGNDAADGQFQINAPIIMGLRTGTEFEARIGVFPHAISEVLATNSFLENLYLRGRFLLVWHGGRSARG
jgi:hypothetical protein